MWLGNRVARGCKGISIPFQFKDNSPARSGWMAEPIIEPDEDMGVECELVG